MISNQEEPTDEPGLTPDEVGALYDGFVRAILTLLELHNPLAVGHCLRVADMTVRLAQAVDRVADGPLQHVQFTPSQIQELQYAAVLRDIGEVGVRESVLLKLKKLYPADFALIRQRYAFIKRTAECLYYKRQVDCLKGDHDGYDECVRSATDEFDGQLRDLEHFMQLVVESNEPTPLPEGNFEELVKYAGKHYQDFEGHDQPYLSDDEVRYLTIRQGSIDESERLEIESHVIHTYRFLMQIPWTKELQFIPQIAYAHHEKLNGTGYPNRVTADSIPIQTRMLTIADIFDALTATDRPYRRAVPVDRALEIMASEVGAGMLDADLFEVFVESKAFEVVDAP